MLIIPGREICLRRNELRFCPLDAGPNFQEFNAVVATPAIKASRHAHRPRGKGQRQSREVEVDDVFVRAQAHAEALG